MELIHLSSSCCCTEPAYAPVRAMSERNAIREELRRQADESRQLKGNIQTLKADLKVAYSQVSEPWQNHFSGLFSSAHRPEAGVGHDWMCRWASSRVRDPKRPQWPVSSSSVHQAVTVRGGTRGTSRSSTPRMR